ncbi:MAG: hypothetical protein M1836_005107 [Candelina mexicana]|nr:MAG: hypothetical protein M1836_005107 [Candelina mexicana]
MTHEAVLSRFGITKEVLPNLSNQTRHHLFCDLLLSHHPINAGGGECDFREARLEEGADFLRDQAIDKSVRTDAARFFYKHNTYIVCAWGLTEFTSLTDGFSTRDLLRRIQVSVVIRDYDHLCQRENLLVLFTLPNLEHARIDLEGDIEDLGPKEGEAPGLRYVAPVIAELKRSRPLNIHLHHQWGTNIVDHFFDPPSEMDKQAVKMGSIELGRYYRVMIPQWTALDEATEAQDAQGSICERCGATSIQRRNGR